MKEARSHRNLRRLLLPSLYDYPISMGLKSNLATEMWGTNPTWRDPFFDAEIAEESKKRAEDDVV